MNNTVKLKGKLISLEESHNHGSEIFYKGVIVCERTSGTEDRIPVVVSQFIPMEVGKEYCVSGSVRTKINDVDNGAPVKSVYVFITDILLEDINNEVHLEGRLVKKPKLRKTTAGKAIADSVIEVRHPQYNKFWYIPVVIWGRFAQFANDSLKKGDKVFVDGRIQSRVYKKTKGTDVTEYEVHEVSVTEIGACSEPDVGEKE